VFIYSGLFGVGSFLYGRTPQALAFTVFFGVSALGLTRLLPLVWGSGGKAGGGATTAPVAGD
jgi:hypothetical protein